MKFDITASIVLYNNDILELESIISSFFDTDLNVRLILVDNSSDDSLKCLANTPNILYIHNESNIGFGKAHNIAFDLACSTSKYHLVLNPDIQLKHGVLEELFDFMNKSEDVGLVMPNVRYPNGDTQNLCKLLPTPFDLIIRRFLPFLSKLSSNYELDVSNSGKVLNIPNLSGCFMFLRTKVILDVGGFDPQFFMYLEDIDLSRRITTKYRTVYYPFVSIVHVHKKESFHNPKLLFIHIKSALYYFNKYGWMFDKERRVINERTLKQFDF